MPNKEFKIFAQISFTVDFKQRGKDIEDAKTAAIKNLKEVFNLKDDVVYHYLAENIDIDVEATDEDALEKHIHDTVEQAKEAKSGPGYDEPHLCKWCGTNTVAKEGDACNVCENGSGGFFRDKVKPIKSTDTNFNGEEEPDWLLDAPDSPHNLDIHEDDHEFPDELNFDKTDDDPDDWK